MLSFLEKFQYLSKQKKSLLIAGIDTATNEMKPEKYYPSNQNKLDFSIDFVDHVMDFCVGIKINLGYWQGQQDGKHLSELIAYCEQKELLLLLDGKYSDIGSTNEAWIFYAKKLAVDAITIAPFAGNTKETVLAAHQKKLAVFTMGLMSNPEFQVEMNFQNKEGVKLYEKRTLESLACGVDGFILGATYPPHNPEVQNFLQLTKKKNILYLIPGVGEQQGSIKNIQSWGIDLSFCLISISRGLMFPKESDFSAGKLATRQKEAARFYQKQIQNF